VEQSGQRPAPTVFCLGAEATPARIAAILGKLKRCPSQRAAMVIDLSFYIYVQAPVATALSLAAGGINQAAVSVSAIIYRLVAGAVQGL
jgi:hypothetical protein